MASCGECRYYQSLIEAGITMPNGELPPLGIGRCRKRPPVALAAPMGIMNVWPQIMSTDWCGEFMPRLGSHETGAHPTGPHVIDLETRR